jgi:hypothetical protein
MSSRKRTWKLNWNVDLSSSLGIPRMLLALEAENRGEQHAVRFQRSFNLL